MPANNQQYITELVTKHKERLHILQSQEAQQGLQTPPHIITEIADIKGKIQLLEQQMVLENENILQNTHQIQPKRRLNIAQVILSLVAVIACIAAVIVVPEVRDIIGLDKPTITSTPAMLTLQPTQSVISRFGRVLDSKTQKPIRQAKVSLEFQGTPITRYTDGEGVYRFDLPINTDNAQIHIRLDVDGYENYDRNITIYAQVPSVDDIRLDPIIPTPTASPTVTPSVIPTLSPTKVQPTEIPTDIPTQQAIINTPQPVVTSQVGDLSGTYDVVGTNGFGFPYRGTATIARKGSEYSISWEIPNSPPASATGRVEGNRFISVGDNQFSFDGDYEILSDGTLSGTWQDRFGQKGTETLKPRK